jgi:hypothetical protein
MIQKAYYAYVPLDIGLTAWWIVRKQNSTGDSISNSLQTQSVKSKMPLFIVFLSIRITMMYYFTSEASKRYLEQGVRPILEKCNP